MIGIGGRGRKSVTHDLAVKVSPSFSPDGRRIAYGDGHHQRFIHIYVVGVDGRNRVRLTHNRKSHLDPAWSPDGQVIAYWAGDDTRPEDRHGTIHLMTADGRYIRQLSDGDNARDLEPDISPLGLVVSPTSKTTTTWGRLKKLAPKLR